MPCGSFLISCYTRDLSGRTQYPQFHPRMDATVVLWGLVFHIASPGDVEDREVCNSLFHSLFTPFQWRISTLPTFDHWLVPTLQCSLTQKNVFIYAFRNLRWSSSSWMKTVWKFSVAVSFIHFSCSLPFYKRVASSLAMGALWRWRGMSQLISTHFSTQFQLIVQLVEKVQWTLYSMNLLNKLNILIF